MAEQVNEDLKALETTAAAAQAAYDAAQSAVEEVGTYAKNLEVDYREALATPIDFDRLSDLQAKRSAVGSVQSDLQAALEVAGGEKDEADEKLRHETRLQQALEELSPKAQALIRAWKAGTLPFKVRLSTGDFALPALMGEYVDQLRRGNVMRVRRDLEDLAPRVDLGD